MGRQEHMGRCDSAGRAAVSVTPLEELGQGRGAGRCGGGTGAERECESVPMPTSSCTEGSSQVDSSWEEEHHGTRSRWAHHSSSWACRLPPAKPGLIPSPPGLSSCPSFQLCSSHVGPPELHVHSHPLVSSQAFTWAVPYV